MQKPKFEHPVILRGNLLVHAHVLRLTEHLTPVSPVNYNLSARPIIVPLKSFFLSYYLTILLKY